MRARYSRTPYQATQPRLTLIFSPLFKSKTHRAARRYRRAVRAAWLVAGLSALATGRAYSFGDSRQLDPEDRSGNWSLGLAYQYWDSVYAGEGRRTDFLPTLTYTGQRLFVDSTDFGWHAIDNKRWQVDLFASYFLQGYNDHSFFNDTGQVRREDDPLKGMERQNALEGGVEITRKTGWGRFGAEFRHDIDNVHEGSELGARWAKVFRYEQWQMEPWAQWQWLSANKADYYFGVRESEASGERPAYTLDATGRWGAGVAFRYTAWDQHHLTLNLAYHRYRDAISDSPVVTDTATPSAQFTYRYELGRRRTAQRGGEDEYNFFTNNGSPTSARLAYGCTTETKFNAIVRGELNCRNDGTGLASVFVGRKLADDLFTLPMEVWIYGGLARRFENNLQDDFFEGVLALKALYRRFPWSKHVETRIGLGHGLSYAERVPNLERTKAEDRNRRISHLLNYLEFSIDVSVGDVLRAERLRNLFFGFAVHHRSGNFASVNLFGNVDGGSNVNTLYLEWEFK